MLLQLDVDQPTVAGVATVTAALVLAGLPAWPATSIIVLAVLDWSTMRVARTTRALR